MRALLGELGVGLLFGLSLMLLNEALTFAGTLLGLQFSFSLVNLLDPNSMIETAVLGQMLGWLGILVILGSGLDRPCWQQWYGASPRFLWGRRDPGEDRRRTGDDGGRDLSCGTAAGSTGDGGRIACRGDDCTGSAVISTVARDDGEHSSEDDGVVCSFDCESCCLAGMDRAALYGVAGCGGEDAGARMKDWCNG